MLKTDGETKSGNLEIWKSAYRERKGGELLPEQNILTSERGAGARSGRSLSCSGPVVAEVD